MGNGSPEFFCFNIFSDTVANIFLLSQWRIFENTFNFKALLFHPKFKWILNRNDSRVFSHF